MSEPQEPKRKKLVDEKITIPPSPFLNRFGFGTGVELFRCPRAVVKSPWAYQILSKRIQPSKDAKKAEANFLQHVSHPNIARFRMYNKHSKYQYLELLYLQGCAMFVGDMIEKKIAKKHEQFLPKQILKVAADIACGLEYLHTKMQVLHGDVKSYNILVKGSFENCQLCDFTALLPLDRNGVLDKNRVGDAEYTGTDAWRAPEVIHGGEVCSKSDVWALGLTLWEMLTLMPPHAVPGCSTQPLPANVDNDDDDVDDAPDDTPDVSPRDGLDRLEESLERIDEYFTDRYGTRPAVPVNVSEKEFMHPLVLFHWCTETEPRKRPTPQELSLAATDMLNHLNYGVWFPHLNHGGPGPLCLTS
ncbi:hypothetical protein PYW08_004145 [Mythimna loreyi]|uniref:Uncharacterized protein n=1 Tax=Mythimna loreyi TaxID=667449 RepID=A0ACC2QWW2_9NEOP|nr:hypothetical protein PYW08_004145 [Mythimna loreyi]